jgi:hypothetical protein
LFGSCTFQILLSDDEDSGLPRSKEERKTMRHRMKELRKKLKAEKKKVPFFDISA